MLLVLYLSFTLRKANKLCRSHENPRLSRVFFAHTKRLPSLCEVNHYSLLTMFKSKKVDNRRIFILKSRVWY